MDQEGNGLHAGAFKKFVHFFRNSFFPVTKCELSLCQGLALWFQLKDMLQLKGMPQGIEQVMLQLKDTVTKVYEIQSCSMNV